jgi:hypothetical protein
VIRLTFFPVFRLYSKKVHRPLGCEKGAVEMKSLELRKLELMSKIHELQMELDRLEWCEYMELETPLKSKGAKVLFSHLNLGMSL